MTLRRSLLRLALASLAGGALTIVLLALLAAVLKTTGTSDWPSVLGIWGVAILLIGWPLATLGHAAGLLVFGMPVLFWWREAFRDNVGRAAIAMALGGLAANVAIVVLRAGSTDRVVNAAWLICGAISGLVWWRLNRDAAINDLDRSICHPLLVEAGWRRKVAAITWMVSLLGAVAVAVPYFQYRIKLSRVPDGIAVDRIVYEKTEDFGGFGPGANETGIFVFAMTATSARALRRVPDLPFPVSNWAKANSQSRWYRTPVDVGHNQGRDWARHGLPTGERHPARIADFLDHYSYGIAIDAKVEATIDLILAAPGSYYAYGGGSSLVVIAPKDGLVIFAYAG